MDREKLKLIVRNLESLVECLKAEIEPETEPEVKDPVYEEIKNFLSDYDEVFYDEEDEL